MNRRTFIKSLFSGLPVIATPTLAASAYAASTSADTKHKIESIIVETDGAYIQNCQFNISGDFALYGDQQQVAYCNFNMQGGTGMCVYTNTNKEAPDKKPIAKEVARHARIEN